MHRRVRLTSEPLPQDKQYAFGVPPWPAKWIGPKDYVPRQSEVIVFRREFKVAAAKKCGVHISADQKYELCVDGEYVGRGIERSDLKNWVYESYDLDLKPGRHCIVIRVWWVSPQAPAAEAQQTYRPGLILYGEGEANELLSTGVAAWQWHRLPGYTFADHDRLNSYFATGAQLRVDGRKVDADVEAGGGGGWTDAETINNSALVALRQETAPWWIMRPAFLPPMYEKHVTVGVVRHVEVVRSEKTGDVPVASALNLPEEQKAWTKLLRKGEGLVVPANTIRRVLIDLDDYYCAYPEIRCSGEGAFVRVHSAESLYHVPAGEDRRSGNSKGNRDEVEGKCFYGVGFEFTAGSRPFTYRPHAFMAGRYVEVVVRTAKTPLKVESIGWLETHFPFKFKAKFASNDAAHAAIVPIALRTLEMCSHDTSMDCPFYERLNYVGDTRLQTLVAYVSADEQRLGEKCIEMFDVSRQWNGLTSSRYPTRTTQTIPPFSLWWVCMVHDYAMWRNDPGFVAKRMPGVRAVLEGWRTHLRENGLLESPVGWNFTDWVPAWRAGIPADGEPSAGFSSILNLHAVYTLNRAAELEDLVGEPLLAQRDRELAASIAQNVQKVFYDRNRKLFADDAAHKLFSEHAQCMAVLSGAVAGPQAVKLVDSMLDAKDLAQTTIYFSHYLFETLGQVGKVDRLLERLEMWKSLVTNGFRTTFESPEPSRSDCHAWGAHPVYHFLATIAGIRPAGFGFDEVVVRPQLGTLEHVEGSMPHRSGAIAFDLTRQGDRLLGRITLPKGLSGRLELPGKTQRLRPGTNIVRAG